MRDQPVPDPNALDPVVSAAAPSMTGTTERIWFIWVTQFDQDVDHAVTDEEMVTKSDGSGRYRAVCGAVFIPAAMEQPPGKACPSCSAVLVDRLPATAEQDRSRRST
jgi:hypothetical protein